MSGEGFRKKMGEMIRDKGRPEVISLGREYASAERKGVTSCFWLCLKDAFDM